MLARQTGTNNAQELNALKASKVIPSADIELLERVPLRASNPALLQCRAGVGDGDHREMVQSYSILNSGSAALSNTFVRLANSINKTGKMSSQPDRRLDSTSCPPATLDEVQAFEARKTERKQERQEALARAQLKVQKGVAHRRAIEIYKKQTQGRQRGADPSKIVKASMRQRKPSHKSLQNLAARFTTGGALQYEQTTALEEETARLDLEECKEEAEGVGSDLMPTYYAVQSAETVPKYPIDGLVFRAR